MVSSPYQTLERCRSGLEYLPADTDFVRRMLPAIVRMRTMPRAFHEAPVKIFAPAVRRFGPNSTIVFLTDVAARSDLSDSTTML
jgi:hypothetical protein